MESCRSLGAAGSRISVLHFLLNLGEFAARNAVIREREPRRRNAIRKRLCCERGDEVSHHLQRGWRAELVRGIGQPYRFQHHHQRGQ